MDRLEEIRQRAEAATPGTWMVKVKGNTVESHQVMSPGNGPVCSAISPKTKNAQFIAHSREDIPYLLAEVDRLQAQLAESQRREQAAVEDFEGCMKNKKERCAYCIHDDECEPGESLCYANVCGFEWRGPQEAGKGETE